MMIPEGMEAKFTCTGTTDPDEVENLEITWKKDNQTINYELAQRVFQNAIDNSVTISGTIYLDTGKYTCVASNGLDSSEASAQLIVQGKLLAITLCCMNSNWVQFPLLRRCISFGTRSYKC